MNGMEKGYIFSGEMERGLAAECQGYLTCKEEVERLAVGDSNDIRDGLYSFLDTVNFKGGELAFVYTHTHSGSGMDQPAARAIFEERGGVIDVEWYDKCTSGFRTRDLHYQPLVVAIRLDPNIVRCVNVRGCQVKAHAFVVGGVNDEASAFATLRGLDDLKNKTDKELKSLTSLSIKNADHERILQALTYLPKLEALLTIGIHWTPKALELLSKAASLKKLRVGGRYWAERNNFKYTDLEALLSLANLESLDLSYTSIDRDGDERWGPGDLNNTDTDDEDEANGQPKPTPEQKLSREFARGMRFILKFPNLKELTLGAKMYPKGAKFLTRHESLVAIRGIESLSYQVVQILADSRLANKITSLDFTGIQCNQKGGPIVAQIAKFTNLLHLGMHNCDALNDAAMKELSPLVNLRELYIPHAYIGSGGLEVIGQLPNISILSLGYCREIKDGLENIQHLNLTHLDVRSIKHLKTEHLLPVLRASPNLIDLNLRYAEGVDAKALANGADLGQLKFLNDLSVPRASKALKEIGATRYYEDQPFHTLPAFLEDCD